MDSYTTTFDDLSNIGDAEQVSNSINFGLWTILVQGTTLTIQIFTYLNIFLDLTRSVPFILQLYQTVTSQKQTLIH